MQPLLTIALDLSPSNDQPLLPLLRPAAASSGPPSRLLTIRTRRNSTGGIGSRGGCAGWNDPQIDSQFRHAAAVNYYNATGIDATSIHQIISGAIRAILTFSIASTVANDIALSRRLVLQLDCEVIQPGFLIVKSDVAIGVELPRQRRRRGNLRGA